MSLGAASVSSNLWDVLGYSGRGPGPVGGVSDNRGTLFGGPVKGILVDLRSKRGTPILGHA